MWYGFGAIALILVSIVAVSNGDRARGMKRENWMVLSAVLMTLGVVSIVACTVTQQP